MSFIGQQKLFKVINSYTSKTLPHTLLFIGPDGCGKKTIAKFLANKLGFDFVKITSNVDYTTLMEYQQKPIRTIYLIDLSQLRLEKDQNKFLKFIEEPSNTVYTILINNSEANILQTILNRCVKLRFESYTIEQLKQIKLFDNELVYKVCTTPGQLNNVDAKKINDLYDLCKAISTKIAQTSYANMLSIVPRINYKEDYNKFEINTFLNMLEVVAFQEYINNENKSALQIYLVVTKRRQALLQNSNIAKETFMTSLLDQLWKETR